MRDQQGKTVECVRQTVHVGVPGSEDGLHGSALVMWSKMSIPGFCMTVTFGEVAPVPPPELPERLAMRLVSL